MGKGLSGWTGRTDSLLFRQLKNHPSFLTVSIYYPPGSFPPGLRKKWDIYTNGIRVLFGNAFGYVACEAAYEGGEEWYQDVKKQIWSNYEYLKHTFAEKLPGAVVSPLEGTYLCWIDLRACIDPEKTKELIQKRCRLAVDFGEWFGGDQFKGFIRMNLATSLKNVQIAVEAICKNV